MLKQTPKTVVGSEEWCVFNDLGIPAIKARVDSGAKTSSLHAFNIQPFKRNSEAWVSFEIHPLQQHRQPVIRCEAKIIDRRKVKSSSGVATKRYVIKTTMQCGNENWEVQLTLSNRDSMGYRMLLGREAMKDRMLVDPSASFCLGRLSEKALKELYSVHKDDSVDGLKLGLLASNPDLYSNKRIVEAALERGHQIEFFDIKQCALKLDSVNPEVHYRSGRILNNFDAIVSRIKPSLNYYGCTLLRQFETMGVHTQNKSEAITITRDRLQTLQLLMKNGINFPPTVFANSVIDTQDLIEMVDGAPMLVKLLKKQSSSSVLAETKKASESVINTFKTLKSDLLVQRHFKDSDCKRIRCLVIDGKVVASILRNPYLFRDEKNSEQDKMASLIKMTLEEKKIALLAAKTLGLKIAGVDLIRTKETCYLYDICSTPGLEGLETATGKDIASMMIASIEKKLGWKRNLAKESVTD